MAKQKANFAGTVPFAPDEELFRRFPPDGLDGQMVALDSIELPDISVNRSRFSKAIDAIDFDEFEGWGVAGVEVRGVPTEILENGVTRWSFAVCHCPCRFKGVMNEAHSEIRAYREQQHIFDEDAFPHEVHLRFRLRLRQEMQVRIFPT